MRKAFKKTLLSCFRCFQMYLNASFTRFILCKIWTLLKCDSKNKPIDLLYFCLWLVIVTVFHVNKMLELYDWDPAAKVWIHPT